MTDMEGVANISRLVEAGSARDFYFLFSFLVDNVVDMGFVKVVYLYLKGLSAMNGLFS